MSKVMLLGAASLAVSLMAAPAFAQNAGGNAADANNPSSTNMAANPPAASTDTGAGSGANTVVGGGKYANVGMGNYSADQQYITGGNANNNNNPGNANNNNNWRPSQRNPLLADNADARANKVIGTNVYNANDQKLGSVDDILIGTNGVFAVISTNNKQVAVPFGDLMFGNASNKGDEKIVIPQETEERLNTLPYFRYDVTNYPGVNANNFNSGSGVNVAGNTNNNAGAGMGSNAGAGAGAAPGSVGVGGSSGTASGAGGGAGNNR